ncbi:MAG: lipo-like protein [Alphaproteobacteria bacterium CG_4_9_14_3_um_filter_47_13]|nr:MAG: lipo-like protein [Alphaproteobacteria bacterium CG_4_9_14_3_um_filter_47_13]
MNTLLEKTGFWLARYLQKEVKGYKPSSTSDVSKLKKCLRPADILLLEGNLRISVAIKYLTQSTWSHAAFYAGSLDGTDDPNCLIEADTLHGVTAVPLSKYAGQHTRICRPIGLTEEDAQKIIGFMSDKIGMTYDMKNAFDLMRYLLPQPPVPAHWRRRMLALGSGDPTRAICSTLIAQAFQYIQYPILPDISSIKGDDNSVREILHIRHHSLFTPRDFDISPYFQIIKPTIEANFDYKKLEWSEGE